MLHFTGRMSRPFNCFTGRNDESPTGDHCTSEDNTASDNTSIASIDNIEDIHSQFWPLADSEQQELCNELDLSWVGPVKHTYIGERLFGYPSSRKVIGGDGNCLFRALCYAITCSEQDHLRIRFLICQHIRLNNTYTGMNGLEYLEQSRMEQPSVYGTDVELRAATDMLSTDIYVFHRLGTQGLKWLRYSNTDRTGPGIYLDNRMGNGRDGHFDYVLGC